MLHVLKHPLIDHKLAIMRNKDTSSKDFKENLDEIDKVLALIKNNLDNKKMIGVGEIGLDYY